MVKGNLSSYAHKGLTAFLGGASVLSCFQLYTDFVDFRERKAVWGDINSTFKDDPYFQYNPNYMRFQKKDEEEVLLTRPLWYCAKGIREKYGIPMQYPYEPIEGAMCDINGKVVVDTSSYAKYLAGEHPEQLEAAEVAVAQAAIAAANSMKI